MTTSDIELLRGAWGASERGAIDTATEVLAPDVRWYAAGQPDAEGACHNREQARAFIRRALEAASARNCSRFATPASTASRSSAR